MLVYPNVTGLNTNASDPTPAPRNIPELLRKVIALMPILTPYSMPSNRTVQNALMELAEPHITGRVLENQVVTAYCLYIAYLLSAKAGRMGVSSESLGEWSVSYADATNPWLSRFNSLVKTSVVSVCADMLTGSHIDNYEMVRYAPDQYIVGGYF